jgi:hypothetical protein
MGPVKSVGYVDMGGGEVRYSTGGWSWFVAGRRRAARTLMNHVCGRLKPVVTEEFTQQDADVPYSQEDISVTMQLGAEHFTLADYTHLVFVCADASTAPVKAQPPQILPPPPRPTAPLVEVFAADNSSAPAAAAVPTAVSVGTAAPTQVAASTAAAAGAAAAVPVLVVSSGPAIVPVVSFSSAPATPALRAPPAPAMPRPAGTGVPAAAWTAFPAGWIPAPAPPKIPISSASPSAVPSGVNRP